MTRTALKIVTKHKPPARSAERERLSEAIANHAAATRALTNARAALERARAFRTEAKARLEKAKSGIEKARDRAVATATSKTTGSPRADGMRMARQAEIDATDALDVASSAIAECEENLAECERNLSWSKPTLARAVDRVLAAECGTRILKEAQQAHDALVAARLQLSLLDLSLLSEPEATAAKLILYNHTFPGGSGSVYLVAWNSHPATLRWRQAREALAKDADAEIDH